MASQKDIRRTKCNETFSRLKPANTYIDNYFPQIEKKYNLNTRLVTCVYNPKNITKDQAWKFIVEDLDKINALFLETSVILFALASVEVHPTKKALKSEDIKGKEEVKTDLRKLTKVLKEELDRNPTEEELKNVHKHYDGKKGKVIKKEQTAGLLDTRKLAGYPHLHIALGVTSYDGKIMPNENISRLIMENTHFVDDVRTDSVRNSKGFGRTRKDTSQGGILKYVLKNCKHTEPYEMLGKKNNVTIFNYSCGKDLLDFFNELTNSKGCIINIVNFSKRIEEKTEEKVVIQETRTTKQRARAFLVHLMIKEGFRLNDDGEVYKRILGSKSSYAYWGTFDRLLGLAEGGDDEMTDIIAENDYHLKKFAFRGEQTIYPKINIDWGWIEYGDFYLHISSCQIIKGDIPKEIETVFYIPDIKFEEAQSKGYTPNYWLAIIGAQKFSNDTETFDKFCYAYYKALMPLRHKNKVMCLLGKANTGKTSALAPLNYLFPARFKLEPSRNKTFQFQGLKNKRLVVLEDSAEDIFRNNNFLQLTEGGRNPLMIEEKGKTPEFIEREFNVIVSFNKLPKAFLASNEDYNLARSVMLDDIIREELNEAYSVRLSLYLFDKKIENATSEYIDIIAQKEYGLVFLFCAQRYGIYGLGREPDKSIIIRDKYEDAYSMIFTTDKYIKG